MFTDEELARKMVDISESSFGGFGVSYSQAQQDKILDKIAMIVRNATKKQLQTRHHPRTLVTCLLRILLYYENVPHMDRFWEWKRRRKFRVARDCFHTLLESYLPEKSREVVETIVETVYQERLWKFESFCFEVMFSLLNANPVITGLIVHAIWNKLTELPEINAEDARGIVRILYELLDIYEWPATPDTVAAVERTLGLYHASIIAQLTTICESLSSSSLVLSSPPPPSPSLPLGSLKKSLEVCMRNIVKNLSNDQLLVIVQHLCSWTVAADANDEFVLEFGNVLEFAAYIHQAGLYEQTLTPTIFPLLMRMVGSPSRLTSLLGNRVLQFLLDRKDNRAVFDTPKIFFEHTRLDLRITQCRKEDRLFFKLHRELLHDNLLKSVINHSDSRMNLEMTYCTMCLIAVEVPCGFTAAALVCFAMNLQEIVLQQHQREEDNRVEIACHVHATIISIMSLICWIHKAKVFYSYVNKIVTERAQWAPHLNPPIQSQYNFALHHVLYKPKLFFIDWEVRYGLWKCFRLTDSQNGDTLIV
ncbi:PREDICTED: protein EFR3 homolog B-like [Wasmannia auropunctata]|uniref:protein EFR3 homolog B-like n=1 Tax=Wasmannia auropunctata TaxID=64793 RepID=UPI0005EF4E8E|nr:PREDICTED: protein EFR3 homolog B-like [Wasmannia auropunctata]